MMVKIFCSNNYSNFKLKSPIKNKILDFVMSLSNNNDISQYGWDYKITRSIWD